MDFRLLLEQAKASDEEEVHPTLKRKKFSIVHEHAHGRGIPMPREALQGD